GEKVRRTIEAQLRQAQKMETIGNFAAGLVHDLRNLLQLLKLNIDTLRYVTDDPEQVFKIADQLDRTTDRGTSMMQEIMIFARKNDAKLSPVNMARQIRETAAAVCNLLPANITLTLRLQEELPLVQADGLLLDRILTNLVVNARDAMPAGGEIAISTDMVKFDRRPESRVPIQDVPYLRVIVSDNGPGMDEELQARIFEPFFTTKPVGKGTGLGLSVVFSLMEAHHGFIELQSQVGEGARFSLYFPLPAEATFELSPLPDISPIRLVGKMPATESVAPSPESGSSS
ncbi:MAG TPA: ATP-binding protein, partial [Candidatus Methylacidiphilales bacterium]